MSYKAVTPMRPGLLRSKKMTHRCGFSIAFDQKLIDGAGLSKSNWCFQEHVRVLCTVNNRARCLNARKTEASLPNRSKVALESEEAVEEG